MQLQNTDNWLYKLLSYTIFYSPSASSYISSGAYANSESHPSSRYHPFVRKAEF